MRTKERTLRWLKTDFIRTHPEETEENPVLYNGTFCCHLFTVHGSNKIAKRKSAHINEDAVKSSLASALHSTGAARPSSVALARFICVIHPARRLATLRTTGKCFLSPSTHRNHLWYHTVKSKTQPHSTRPSVSTIYLPISPLQVRE